MSEQSKRVALPAYLPRRLQAFRIVHGDQTSYLLRDKLADKTHDLEPWQFFVLEVLPGCEDVAKLRSVFEDRFGRQISEPEILRFFGWLADNKLLDEEFRHFQGTWPGWCKNVVTMYAGELALRRTYPQQCSLGLLDHLPYANRALGSDVLHIHAWHTDQYWSKHQYRAGKYAGMALDEIDRRTSGGYCHWLAVADVEQVRAAVD